MASRPGKNPFFDDDKRSNKREDDDVDDMTFLKSRPNNYVLGNSGSGSRSDEDYVQKRQQLMEERRRIEERTLASSKASLGLVYESEKVGLSTAEELIRQGEKLTKVDEGLDAINSTMRTTQKHLTSMKSMFGGIKNYFSKSDAPLPPPMGTKDTDQVTNGSSSRPKYESQLGSTLESMSNNPVRSQNHPTFARKGIIFEEDEQDAARERMAVGKTGYSTRSKEIDKALDDNLSELGLGLGRLKNLAIGLGTEIETQNDMIERIMTKKRGLKRPLTTKIDR